jgi:hypothetical protein
MASIFKPLANNDITNTRTLLHEAIPITGTLVSGTYGGATVALGSEPNIKTYAHGMFESVYDYPYLSSSANHVFDLTVGYSADSVFSGSGTQNAKKINIYNQMASVLMGHDISGNIQQFDEDGDIMAGGTKLKSCVFMNFARLLTKDEIKKGTFSLTLGASASFDSGSTNRTEMNSLITITDTNAATQFKVNSPTGEYGILYGTGSVMPASTPVGLLFYQAGVAVLTSSIWDAYGSNAAGTASNRMDMSGSGNNLSSFLTGATIQQSCDFALRHRINNLTFNNTTELNSTVYFCRANNSEFNYSANPTYLSASKMRVKNTVTDDPVSYITTVGLYSPDNELLAVAKLSEPLKKTPQNELTVRVRLDY